MNFLLFLLYSHLFQEISFHFLSILILFHSSFIFCHLQLKISSFLHSFSFNFCYENISKCSRILRIITNSIHFFFILIFFSLLSLERQFNYILFQDYISFSSLHVINLHLLFVNHTFGLTAYLFFSLIPHKLQLR